MEYTCKITNLVMKVSDISRCSGGNFQEGEKISNTFFHNIIAPSIPKSIQQKLTQ